MYHVLCPNRTRLQDMKYVSMLSNIRICQQGRDTSVPTDIRIIWLNRIIATIMVHTQLP